MPRDVHVIAEEKNGEFFILIFDDCNRYETIDQLINWSIDPSICLTTQQSRRLVKKVQAVPRLDGSPPPVPLRGGLGKLEV